MQVTELTATSKNQSSANRELKRRLPGRLFYDEDSRFHASLDNLRLSFLPDAVVRVQEASDVGVVLQLATRYGVPVTSRGAGSSATGSAVPLKGGWALDLSGLNQVVIDPVAR
ncbi:MAG: FAD-binding protein, partial [Verrucomicrobia bacterium]|nr:FAD-binding protein [Verrucomicrobiota bacterium]